MDNTTIVAIVMLVGVFVIMILAMLKEGVDGAVKIWSVMGAITGAAIGAITSYYFTNESNQAEIQAALNQKSAVEIALKESIQKAAEANKFVSPFASALQGTYVPSKYFPLSKGALECIPIDTRRALSHKVAQTSLKLKEIEAVKLGFYEKGLLNMDK